MSNYSDALNEAIRLRGLDRGVPQLLDCWQSLIEDCEDGYQWDVSEYNSELRMRKDIETLLTDKALSGYDEHRHLQRQVDALDSRFRRLLHHEYKLAGKKMWWEHGVLAKAGPLYVDYFRAAYGFELSTVDEE